MKAVFPSKGVLIITKYNVNVIKKFYKNNLINSKLFETYQKSNNYVEIRNFNYFPKHSNIVLENANLLTLRKLQEIVSTQMREHPEAILRKSEINSEIDSNDSEEYFQYSDEPLDDNFIKNNPFFITLNEL